MLGNKIELTDHNSYIVWQLFAFGEVISENPPPTKEEKAKMKKIWNTYALNEKMMWKDDDD